MKKIELNLLEIHHSHYNSFWGGFFSFDSSQSFETFTRTLASGLFLTSQIYFAEVFLKRFLIDSNPKKNLVTFDMMASNFFPFRVCFIIQEGVGISVSVYHCFHSSSASVQNMVLNFRVLK